MAKQNYRQAKRNREETRKKRQLEKRQRKLGRPDEPASDTVPGTDVPGTDAVTGAVTDSVTVAVPEPT